MKIQFTKQTLAASHRILSLFLLGLGLFAVTYWAADLYAIYQRQQHLAQQASNLRADIYVAAREFGAVVTEYDRAQEQQAKAMAPPPPQSSITVEKDGKVIKHKVVPETKIEEVVPPRPRVEDTNIPSKIQLLGLLEIELSETTSWHTVLKLVVSVLVTLFGIKSINLIFRRLEQSLTH